MGNDVHHEFSGTAHYVIQARDIAGGIHIHAAVGASPIDRAAEELASLVFGQWRAEANLRGLGGSAPMAVPWQTDWSLADHPAKAGSAAERGGGLSDLAAAFQQLRQRRLVVVGPAGAGKSSLAILLALELLREREPNDPVPVILSLSTWDVGEEHLDVWIAIASSRNTVAGHLAWTAAPSDGLSAIDVCSRCWRAWTSSPRHAEGKPSPRSTEPWARVIRSS
jgi:hypothetical protein